MYARCVRDAGHVAEVWSYGPPAFDFGADMVVDVGRYRSDASYRWDLLDRAVREFDVFHFFYGRSLLDPDLPDFPPLLDLPLLKSLDKKLIMNYRGSDVRLRSVHLQREPDSYMRDPAVVCDEERILADISVARRYCDALLVSTPGLIDYVPDAMWLPHVVDVDWWAGGERSEPTRPRVAHMPSRRGTKASDVVDAVANDLARRGVIEYVPLTGLDRTGIRDAFRSVDIVVDSLTIGDHGLVSVEAMAAGAIAVAHVHERNRERNPGVPVVEATVHDLGSVLEDLANDVERRAEIRRASAGWVRSVHSMEAVGPTLIDLYRRPVRRSGLSEPSFPVVAGSARVRSLEAEVESLRATAKAGGRLQSRGRRERTRDEIEMRVLPMLRRVYYRSGLSRIVGAARRRLRKAVRR